MLGGGDLPFSDIFVAENTTVRSADGLVVAVHSAEAGGSVNLDTLHLSALRLLSDVLNCELATGGLHFLEAV